MSGSASRDVRLWQDAVLDEDAKILMDEGFYTVAGIYYASQADAAIQRRWEAERRVREKAQRVPLVCAFCYEQMTGQVAVVLAMRSVHPACAKAFDAWITQQPAENDARWLSVADDSPVEFEGEMCRWGDLAMQDRKVVEMTEDGRLVGEYPF